MKIAFWSNCSGRAGTTSNMACISVICSMLNQTKSVLFENHFSLNGLEQAFINERREHQLLLREELSYYDQTGLEGLIRRIHANHTYEKVMEDIALKFLDDFIYYLPKNHNGNPQYFEFELNQVIQQLFQFLDQMFDMVFVDTAFHQTLSTKLILDEVQLVVVNLCQNKNALDHFFSHYTSLIQKSIFLVGNYQEQSQFNLKNIRRRYQLSKEQIGVIPFNLEFADAVNNGEIVEYLKRNLTCGRQDNNYYFIHQAKQAAHLIMKRLEKEVSVVF